MYTGAFLFALDFHLWLWYHGSMRDTSRNTVIVDIDNTVHESDITMNLLSMELFNSPFRWCKQDQWYTGADPNMPMEHALKVFDRLHDRDMIFLTSPYVGSKEGLERIQAAGYTINYYTDRKLSSHQDTYDWLVKHGLPNPDGLKCSMDKRAALAEIKDSIATVIDDRVRTMLFVQYELGIKDVYSLRQPYNRNMDDAPGVHLANTWAELADTFLTNTADTEVTVGAGAETG